eukprot:5864213-Alexandrium_andersonii.AAC.1
MSAEQRVSDLEQRVNDLGTFAEQARRGLQASTNRIQTLEQEVERLRTQQATTGNYLNNIRIATGIPETGPTP